ncbi:MAG: 2-oxoacid:acceptor oxidoreductase family protein [candidate division WOR-3 bacterium]
MIEIKIVGKGGQGIVLAGEILAHAAILKGKFASAIAGYSSQARGGDVSCDVMISEKEISSPFVLKPEYLISLASEGYEKIIPLISEETKVFLDATICNWKWERNHFPIPAQKIAQEVCQSPQVANMVILGYFARRTEIVSLDNLCSVLKEKMKGKTLEVNIKALKEGYFFGGNYEDKDQ